MMESAILCVDDEENILNALERVFAETNYRFLRAPSAKEALNVMATTEISVVISDNFMPEMKGIDLLSRIAATTPDTMRILMTGQADLQTAVEAINRGEVYRFVMKPWKEEELIAMVDDASNRYSLLKAFRASDEGTLRSLAQTIELKDRYTRGHCDRVSDYALLIADSLRLDEKIKESIKRGSWLHDCGKIGVPDAILNFPGPLDQQALAVMSNHPVWGADVARQANLSPVVINIIRHHHERYDGNGYPDNLHGTAIPLEARIVAVADVYDALTTDRPYRKGHSPESATPIMHSLKGSSLDPELVDILLARVGKQEQ